MNHDKGSTLRERVNQYLCGHALRGNAFVAEVDAAEADHANAAITEMNGVSAAMGEDAELREYQISRAKQELRSAKEKLDSLKQKIAEANY